MKRISAIALLVFAATMGAQEPAAAIEKKLGPADIIMPHITDSKHLELPCIRSFREWACEVELPTWNVTIGGRVIDFGPTKHVVFMLFAAFIACVVLVSAAQAHKRHSHEVGRPKGFAAGVEAVILLLRGIFMEALGGHGAEKFVKFPLALFFFVLFCNLFGLIPYGSTATGNLSVTAALAILTFFVVEITGMRTLGAGYINTIVYWPHDMPLYLKLPLTIIMSPMELMGKFIKPFALTIRLFANMIGGHVVILSFIGLIFMFGFSLSIAPSLMSLASLAMALAIMGLEILVSLIQAFIFSLLSAVFIGQMRTAHH
jgi:F-type H+-transporting ATPase subunit a